MTRLYVALALVTALASQVDAGGFGIPEVGVRRTAMGAVIGRPDELTALYHNPAGLVLADEWRLYVSGGLSVVRTQFELRPWDRSDEFLGVTPEASGYYRPTKPDRAWGLVPMLAAGGPIRDRMWVGGALTVGNAAGASFDEDAVTHYHLIEGYVVAPQATASFAYKLTDTLALAATAGIIYFKVHGRRYVFPVVDGNDISMLAGTKPELVLDGSAWAPTWNISAFGTPHPRVTWGAALIGRVDADLKGPVEITYSDDASSPGDTLIGTQTTKQLLPWTLQGGANVDVHPNIEIGAEIRYWLYRQYKEQRTDVVGIFLVRELVTQKNYHDSIMVSGGVRVHDLAVAPRLELMAGSHYDRTPAPPQTVTLDQPSFPHWGVHSGLRYDLGRFRVGASYIYYHYRIPTITDSITMPPSNVRGRGSNNIMTLSLEARL